MRKILLGYNQNFKIYTDRLSSKNGHVLITGKSGAGKTTALMHLAQEISANKERVYFLDYADCITTPCVTSRNILHDWSVTHTFEQHESHQNAVSTLLCYSEIIADIWSLGEKQKMMITDALLQLERKHSIPLNTQNPFYPFLNLENGQLRGDIVTLAYLLSNRKANEYKNLANRFLDIVLLLEDSFYTDMILEDNVPTYLTILNYPAVAQKLIAKLTDLFLWSIFLKHVGTESPPPVTIICDEIGLLNWRNSGILQKLLNEGRKFNINLILATQSLTDKLPKSAINAVMQADLHLAFTPTVTDYKLIAKSLYNKATQETISSLSDLPTGECFVRGHLCSDKTPTFEQTLKVHIPYEEDL